MKWHGRYLFSWIWVFSLLSLISVACWAADSKSDRLSDYNVSIQPPCKPGNVDTWGPALRDGNLPANANLELSGWARDPDRQVPAAEIFIVNDNKILSRIPVSGERPDVADYYKIPTLKKTGWAVDIPGHALRSGQNEVAVYALCVDGMTAYFIDKKLINVTPAAAAGKLGNNGIYYFSRSYTPFSDADYYVDPSTRIVLTLPKIPYLKNYGLNVRTFEPNHEWQGEFFCVPDSVLFGATNKTPFLTYLPRQLWITDTFYTPDIVAVSMIRKHSFGNLGELFPIITNGLPEDPPIDIREDHSYTRGSNFLETRITLTNVGKEVLSCVYVYQDAAYTWFSQQSQKDVLPVHIDPVGVKSTGFHRAFTVGEKQVAFVGYANVGRGIIYGIISISASKVGTIPKYIGLTDSVRGQDGSLTIVADKECKSFTDVPGNGYAAISSDRALNNLFIAFNANDLGPNERREFTFLRFMYYEPEKLIDQGSLDKIIGGAIEEVSKKYEIRPSTTAEKGPTRTQTDNRGKILDHSSFKNNAGKSPSLQDAIIEGNSSQVKVLLDKGHQFQETNENGRTPLMTAIAFGRDDITKFLIERGAEVNAADKEGFTPLMLAASIGNNDIVASLLRKGAKIEARNSKGRTALMLASANGKLDTVQLLLNQGANPSQTDYLGFNAFLLASSRGWVNVMKLMLERKLSSLDDRSLDGSNALMVAASKGTEDAVAYLLHLGIDPNCMDSKGFTPLHAVAATGNVEVMKMLINGGATINARAENGFTPLMTAAACGNDEAVRFLVESGANIRIRNVYGKIARDIAEEKGLSGIRDFLTVSASDK